MTVVALTGFMAAGKTTAGRSLASLLRWNFIDLDYEVERRSGMGIQEIFSTHGEPHFRELEAAALRSLIENVISPTIIALGGGTFVQPQNAQRLRDHGARVVFLELPIEHLLQRCRAGNGRPNPRPLAADEAALRRLYEQRLPFYRQADLTVSTEGKSCNEIVCEIATALRLPESASDAP